MQGAAMNRHERRRGRSQPFVMHCLTCKRVFYQSRGKLEHEALGDPAIKVAFDAHRAKYGCPEDPVKVQTT
jgi:hypothetical protein